MKTDIRTLKYGDVVRIHGASIKKQDKQGVIMSKGFTDPNIYFLPYQQLDKVKFYRETLFQIIPKSSFHIHNQLAKENLSSSERNSIKLRARSQIQALQTNFEQQATQGQDVVYGASILFRHVDTQFYLKGVLQVASSGQGSFKLELNAQLSSFLEFKILSHRSYQTQGNKVYLDDQLQIYHTESCCYVNYIKDPNKPVFIDTDYELINAQQDEEDYKYTISPCIKKPDPGDKRFEVVNQNKSKTLWKLQLHQDYNSFTIVNIIKNRDIVYFEHTKQKGILCSSLKNFTPFLKYHNVQNTFYDCLWEMLPAQTSEKEYYIRNIITGKQLTVQYDGASVSLHANGIGQRVIVKAMQKSQDGQLRNNDLVVLTFNNGQKKIDRGNLELPRKNESKIVEYYERDLHKIELKFVDQLSEHSFKILKPKREILQKIIFVLSSFESLTKFWQAIQLKPQKQELQQIRKNNKDEKKINFYEILFSRSNSRILQHILFTFRALIAKIYNSQYQEYEKMGNSPNKQIQKIIVETGVAEIVINIIYFLALNYDLIARDCKESRSDRTEMLKVFDCAYKLLEIVTLDFEENRIYLSRWSELILGHSYRINRSCVQECLIGILKNNLISINSIIGKDKIQDLVEKFRKQAQENNHEPNTKYLRLLSTFIKINDVVIKQNQDYVLELFFKYQVQKQDENFEINNKSEKKNTNTYKFEFKKINKKLRNDNKIEVIDSLAKLGENREALISFNKRDFVTLTQFFRKQENLWNYFISYVNLMADVCKSRNKSSIDQISKILDIQTVLIIIEDPNIRTLFNVIQQRNQLSPNKFQNVYQPFMRIAHHVYVDISSFDPIRRINRIRQWYEIKLGEQIPRTKRQFLNEKEQEQKKYLKMILELLVNFLKNNNLDNSNSNKMLGLYTCLDLLKITVCLGLWNQVAQFRQLIPSLVFMIIRIDTNYIMTNQKQTILQSTNLDKSNLKNIINMNKSKFKMAKSQMMLAIQCKRKASEIFNLMIQMQTNIRVSEMVVFFKGLYDAQEKFEEYNIAYKEEGEYNMNELQIKRNKTAFEAFKGDTQSSTLIFTTKKNVQKQIIFLQNIWLNKLQELTPLRTDTDIATGHCKRYIFEKIDNFNLMILAVLENTAHFDIKLLNSLMLLLTKIFGQRHDLIYNFNNIVICGKGHVESIIFRIKYILKKLNCLIDNSIKNLPVPLSKIYNAEEIREPEQQKSGIIQDLFFLSRVFRKNVNIKNVQELMSVDEELLLSLGDLFNPKTQKQQNQSLFQIIALVYEIHIPLFNYLNGVSSKPTTDQEKKLMLSIYNYLTLLAFNNLECKLQLLKYIQISLKHLSFGVGACNFISEICYNNKYLIHDETLCKYIVTQIVEASNCLSIESYNKAKILHTLRNLVIFDGKGHSVNQKMVLNIIQENKYRGVILKMRPSQIIQKPIQINPLDFNISAKESYACMMFEILSGLIESENMINIGKLSNIHPYEVLVEWMSHANTWQLRHCIRSYVNRLYYIVREDDIFLFEYFIRYQFKIINTQLSELANLQINYQFEDIQLSNAMRFTYAGSHAFLTLMEILISLQHILVKNSFLNVLIKQLKKQDRKQMADQKKDKNMYLHNQIIQICQFLGHFASIKDKFVNKFMRSFIEQVQKLFKPVLLEFRLDFLDQKCSEQINEQPKEQLQGDLDAPEKGGKYFYDNSKSFFKNLYFMLVQVNLQRKKKNLKDKYQFDKNKLQYAGSTKNKKMRCIDQINTGGTIITNYKKAKNKDINNLDRKAQNKRSEKKRVEIKTTNSQHFKLLAREKRDINEENIQLNKKIEELKEMLIYGNEFKKWQQDQIIKLVGLLTNLDYTSKQYYTTYVMNTFKLNNFELAIIPFDQILTNMFKLTQQNPNDLLDYYKIYIIKIARYYITQSFQKNQIYKLPPDQWDGEYLTMDDQQNINELKIRQNKINECGGAQFIVAILTQNLDNRIEILNQVLLLGIAFLYNGNRQCQNKILEVLIKDTENKMLVNLNNLIDRIGIFIYNTMKMEAPKKQDKLKTFNSIIQDSYDYLHNKSLERFFKCPKNDKLEDLIKKNYQNALCRSFRFLQLFCENNNIQMKRFILSQTNEDLSVKNYSINFIETTTLLLRKFFKIMNKKMHTIPLSLLDFVTQVCQVPCIQNQIALSKSSYFQDLCYMAGQFENPDHMNDRLFLNQEEIQPLYEAYDKSIQLALSNFEGCNNIIFQEFIKKCQPKFLWLTLKRKFNELIQKYNDNNLKEIPNAVKIKLQNLDENHLARMIDQENHGANQFEQPLLSILNIYIIINKINDFKVKLQLKIDEEDSPSEQDRQWLRETQKFLKNFTETGRHDYRNIEQLSETFKSLLLRIEITSKNDDNIPRKQNIYFPKHPVFKQLSSQTKDRIMFQIKRDTIRDKLIWLLNARSQIYKQIEWNYEMKKQKLFRYFQISAQECNKIRSYSLILSLIILLFMILLIQVDHDKKNKISYYDFPNYTIYLIMKCLSIIQLILTLIYFRIWFILKAPLAMIKNEVKIKKQKQLEKQQLNRKYQDEGQEPNKKTGELNRMQSNKQMNQQNHDIKTHLFSKIITKYHQINESFDIWLNKNQFYCLSQYQNEFTSTLLFIIISLLGNFLGIQYYLLYLFDLFLSINLLGNVFKAITLNRKALQILALLCAVFIFVFNIISWKTYVVAVYQEDDPTDACENIVDCVFTLYTSGVINDQMDELDPFRFTFDLIYLVFMQILMGQIIGGKMIDTFGALSTKDDQILYDKKNICFICGVQKQDLEKQGILLKDHIKNHDLWTYVYYVFCLDKKDPTDYTGIQYAIINQMKQQSIEWFPVDIQNESVIQNNINAIVEKMKMLKNNSDEDINLTLKCLEDHKQIQQPQKIQIVQQYIEPQN